MGEEGERATARAAEALAHGDLEEVGRIALDEGDPELLRTALRRALWVQPPAVPGYVLRGWRASGLLPADDADGRWLGATCEALDGAPPADVLAEYRVVRAAFAAAGDVESEISAGMAAAVVARRNDDLGEVLAMAGRAEELVAAGHQEAAGPGVLVRALGRQLVGDPRGALDALTSYPLDRYRGDWGAQVAMVRGTNHLLLDEPIPAVRHLEQATGLGSPWSYATSLELLASARWVAGDPVRALEDLAEAERIGGAVGAPAAVALARAQRAVVLASLGDEAAALDALAVLGDATDEDARRLAGVARALVAVGRSTGDDDGEAAAAVAALEVPGRADRASHWVVALRAAAGTEAAADEVRAVAEQHPSLAVARSIGEQARAARASGGRAPASAARLLPRSWCEPIPPVVELVLAGRSEVRVDRVPSAHRDWERARVRELCLHLAVVDGASRTEVASRLWPDLDPAAAQRNLRVTLTYLLNVVHPDRDRGASSDLIEDRNDVLRFAEVPRLRIDVRDQAGLAAAVVAAAPHDDARALAAARRLVRHPGGRLLAGALPVAWVEDCDARRREQLIAAAAAAGPVALRSGDADLALALAERGLVEDPWGERLHQTAIRAHLARDDLDGARRAVRRALTALDDLGVAPEPVTRELAALVGMAT